MQLIEFWAIGMKFKKEKVYFTPTEKADTGFLSPMPTDEETIFREDEQLQREETDLAQDIENSYRLPRSEQAQLPLRQHRAVRKRMVINHIAREKGIKELPKKDDSKE